jgi:hypothetical protein
LIEQLAGALGAAAIKVALELLDEELLISASALDMLAAARVASATAVAAFACAAALSARAATTIAFSVAMSSGRESKAFVTMPIRTSTGAVAMVHLVAESAHRIHPAACGCQVRSGCRQSIP